MHPSFEPAHEPSLLQDGAAFSQCIDQLIGLVPSSSYDVVCGIESRGFLFGAPLALRTYELIESTDHAGTLRLTFNAQDSVGLLGSLLLAFSSLSLLPVEMHIETRDKEACDCLWLATANAGKPSAKDKVALDALLRSTVQH